MSSNRLEAELGAPQPAMQTVIRRLELNTISVAINNPQDNPVNAYATNMESVAVSDRAPKRRLQSNTRGNRGVMPAVKKRMNRQRKAVPEEPLFEHTDDDILGIVNSESSKMCCGPSTPQGGCLRKAFLKDTAYSDGRKDLDYEKAIAFVRAARAERGDLSGDQLDSFIQEKYRAVLVKAEKQSDGSVKFLPRWSYKGISLCRQSYANAFGITKHQLDMCSKALKHSDNRRVPKIKHQPFKDEHVHEFTFAETEEIFKKNLHVDIIGKPKYSVTIDPTVSDEIIFL